MLFPSFSDRGKAQAQLWCCSYLELPGPLCVLCSGEYLGSTVTAISTGKGNYASNRNKVDLAGAFMVDFAMIERCTGFGVSFRFPRSREVIGLDKKTTNLVLFFELQKKLSKTKNRTKPTKSHYSPKGNRPHSTICALSRADFMSGGNNP